MKDNDLQTEAMDNIKQFTALSAELISDIKRINRELLQIQENLNNRNNATKND